MDTFNDHSDAYFMWTARNEIEDKWSFINAYDKGWIDYQPEEGVEHEENRVVSWLDYLASMTRFVTEYILAKVPWVKI